MTTADGLYLLVDANEPDTPAPTREPAMTNRAGVAGGWETYSRCPGCLNMAREGDRHRCRGNRHRDPFVNPVMENGNPYLELAQQREQHP